MAIVSFAVHPVLDVLLAFRGLFLLVLAQRLVFGHFLEHVAADSQGLKAEPLVIQPGVGLVELVRDVDLSLSCGVHGIHAQQPRGEKVRAGIAEVRFGCGERVTPRIVDPPVAQFHPGLGHQVPGRAGRMFGDKFFRLVIFVRCHGGADCAFQQLVTWFRLVGCTVKLVRLGVIALLVCLLGRADRSVGRRNRAGFLRAGKRRNGESNAADGETKPGATRAHFRHLREVCFFGASNI